MKDRKLPYINLAGSAVFVLLVLRQLFSVGGTMLELIGDSFFSALGHGILSLPFTALCALMAYSLAVNWRNKIPAYGLAAYAVIDLLAALFNLVKGFFAFDIGIWLSNLPGLIGALGLCALALLAIVRFTNLLPQLHGLVRKVWYVPSAVLALDTLIGLILALDGITFGLVYFYILRMAGWCIINLWLVAHSQSLGSVLPFLTKGAGAVSSAVSSQASAVRQAAAAKKAATPRQAPEAAAVPQPRPAGPAQPQNRPAAPVQPQNRPAVSSAGMEGYCGMGKHVLLLFFTFGIWKLIWIYRTTRYLNRTPGKDARNPTAQLLLCLFVPFYAFFWVYQSGKRIDLLASYRKIPSSLAGLCLVLEIFLPFLPPILMQSKINAIAEASAPAYPRSAAPQRQPARSAVPPQGRAPEVQNPPAPSAQSRPASPAQNPPAASQPPAPSRNRPTAPADRPRNRPAAPTQGRPAAPMQGHPQPPQAPPAAAAQKRPTDPAQAVSAPALSREVVQELRLYKDLMDTGVITKEEFVAHKRRLLGR